MLYAKLCCSVRAAIITTTACFLCSALGVDLTQYSPAVCNCTVTNTTQNSTAVNVVCNSRNIPTTIRNDTTDLVLHGLHIDTIPDNIFSPLHKLCSLVITSFTVNALKEKSFSGLISLQTLILKGLTIHRIDQFVFSPLIAIKYINLNDNKNIGLKRIAVCFSGLVNSSIERLDLNNINKRDHTLTESFFKHLRGTALKNISLSDNVIAVIEHGFIPYIPHLESFILSNNVIVGENEALVELLFLRQIRIIDLSYQRALQTYKPDAKELLIHPIDLKFNNQEEINNIPRNINDICKGTTYFFSPTLEVINFKHYSRGPKRLDGVCVTTNNSLKVLDLSENVLHHIKGEFVGFIHLEILDLSRCNCKNLPFRQFQYLPSLKELRMGYNLLGNIIQSDHDGSMFSKNHKLGVLDISNNGIQTLSDAFIQSVKQLKKFDISGNKLMMINNFSGFSNLRVLDLSENKIENMNAFHFKMFDKISYNHTLCVYLAHNPFTKSAHCCYIEDFIIWTQSTNVKISDLQNCTCISKHGNIVALTNFTKESIHRMCTEPPGRDYKLTLSVIVVSIFLTSVIIATLGYRARWRLRWTLLASRRFLRLRNDAADTKVYDFDAFVSYNVEDIKWVKDHLIVELEVNRGFRLCIHHRDFLPGVPIEENIVDAIERSRKTILLLTPNFVKSNWCHFEIQMARNKLIEKGYDIIVPIILEPFDVMQTSRTLRNILDKNTYLEWQASGPGNEYFWKNLSDVLKQGSRNDLLE